MVDMSSTMQATVTLPVNYSTKNYRILLTPNREIVIDRYFQSYEKNTGSFKVRTDASSVYMEWFTIGC